VLLSGVSGHGVEDARQGRGQVLLGLADLVVEQVQNGLLNNQMGSTVLVNRYQRSTSR